MSEEGLDRAEVELGRRHRLRFMIHQIEDSLGPLSKDRFDLVSAEFGQVTAWSVIDGFHNVSIALGEYQQVVRLLRAVYTGLSLRKEAGIP